MSSKTVDVTKADEEIDSDVEMEGMDLEDDDGQVDEAGDDEEATESDNAPVENEEDFAALATEEAQEMEEARRERTELMAAEQKKAMGSNPQPLTAAERLEYILAQSDVFAHFLAGT